MNKKEILNKFSDKEEKLTFAKILDTITLVDKQKSIVFSSFLNPAILIKMDGIMKNFENLDVKYKPFGGIEEAERKMVAFYPANIEVEDLNFPIISLSVTYNQKYSKSLTHRSFLGSIIGLGLDRSVIGDIIVKEEETIIFVSNTISEYIIANLEKVGSTKVNVSNNNKIIKKEDIGKEMTVSVSSMRLDNILASVFKISRSKSNEFIKSGKVFINWNVVLNASKTTEVGDLITLRGFGRIKIKEVLRKSKKDKFILDIIKY
jgi:RNA-binding protein YlmH